MRLKIGFSPCPNDTFMMDALIHSKVNTADFEFDLIIEDVERLNERAFKQEIDITKISYHAFLHVADTYQMLNSGSALGFGVGPLLISRTECSEEEILAGPIALPGKWTTAHWLFSLRYPTASNKKFILFSEIESAVARGDVQAGVIIHENRFTYADRGFTKILDLGMYWENQTNLPIPLGGIAVRRELDPKIKKQLDAILKESIAFAFQHPHESMDFVRTNAQEMDDDIMQKHIQLYVNEFSLDLQEKGVSAISTMFELSQKAGLISEFKKDFIISR